MLAGSLNSINGTEAAAIQNSYYIYGFHGADVQGLTVSFTPSFTYAETHYYSDQPMTVSFPVKKGGSYDFTVLPNEPKADETILLVSPIVNKKIIFKTTFYIVVTDTTDSKTAKLTRGEY